MLCPVKDPAPEVPPTFLRCLLARGLKPTALTALVGSSRAAGFSLRAGAGEAGIRHLSLAGSGFLCRGAQPCALYAVDKAGVCGRTAVRPYRPLNQSQVEF